MSNRAGEFFNSLKQFSRSFWSANISELFERVAFYGMTGMLVRYLTSIRGFTDDAAYALNGNFTGIAYALPVISGFIADWLGYRRAFMMAYVLLAGGYFLLGQFDTYLGIAGALLLVAFGASIVKPTVTGTVRKTSTGPQAALGFSIYYMLVNIGGFLGPNLSGQVSKAFGLQNFFYPSVIAAIVALLLIVFSFKEPGTATEKEEKKSLAGFGSDFLTVIGNWRLMLLFVWVTGYWCVFYQIFGPLPIYLAEDLGVSDATVGLVIGLDALAIVILQVLVGYLVRNMVTVRAVLLAFLVSSVGFIIIAFYPSVWVVGAGILVWAIGEMIYAAHFYKYMGDMAPDDQVGMYMGFAFLPVALGGFLAGQIAGPIASLARDTLGKPQLMWLFFGCIGLLSAAGLFLQTLLFKPREARVEPEK